ncbi:hypothetical protein ACFWD7_46695 [Streptomyces mirabilis]|uniref:hypothetical protein n=1 Tax=Streptomyces mirabilis TaxID=68239 RepID=UPI0036B2B66A
MPCADIPSPFPTGWPKGRYRDTRRAMKALRIADHLLRRGLAYTPGEATDEVIRTAARQSGHRHPSETTCALVRAVLELLLSPTNTASPDEDEASSAVRVVVTIDRPTA